jgi:group I intron endonuclease
MYNSKRHTDVVTGIYCFTNKVNGKQYVGLSVDIAKRYANHIGARSPRGSAMFLPIRKYGIEAFTFEVLEECDAADLNEREIYWIAKLDSYNTGYNRTTGGEGTSGFKVSDKTKAKHAAAKRGKKASTKTKAKMAASHTGKTFTDEHKANIAASKKGIKPLAATAAAMKEVIVTTPNGTVLIFESGQAAAEALGLDKVTLSRWAGGRSPQPGQGKRIQGAAKLFVGWTFQYKS